MNWLVLIIAFAVGAMVAGAAARRFQRTAARWSRVRRVLSAAALVPFAMIILFILGTVWAYATLPEGGEAGRDMTIFVFGLVGLVLGIPALIGGLVGGAAAERRR